MKKLTKLLTRFTIFSATACAILFGLPALATRHPFILQFVVSLVIKSQMSVVGLLSLANAI